MIVQERGLDAYRVGDDTSVLEDATVLTEESAFAAPDETWSADNDVSVVCLNCSVMRLDDAEFGRWFAICHGCSRGTGGYGAAG